MSQFFKKFLAEEGIGSSLALGAFGKHPGWDDHVEDLGLESETLNLAKRILYVQGVGGQIDRGAWEKLEPANRTEGFNHIFLWQRSGQYLLGKMWSSSDGKGRTRYPMVICAHCAGTSLAWGLQNVLPRLDQIEKACKNTQSAAEVREILGRARTDLRALLGPGSRGEYAPVAPDSLSRFVADPSFSADQHGWFRILYQIQNQMAAYHAGQFNPRGDPTAWRPQQLRVPAAGRTPAETLLLWTRFIGSQIDRQVPSLFMLEPGEPYLDIVLGEPTNQEFFCLRARPAVLPLTTDVPYELDEKFTSQAKRTLADFQAGKETPIAEAQEDTNSTGAWSSFTQRFFKSKAPKVLLLLALCVLLAGAGTYSYLKFVGTGKRPTVDPQVVKGNDSKTQLVASGVSPVPAKSNPPVVIASAVPTKKSGDVVVASSTPGNVPQALNPSLEKAPPSTVPQPGPSAKKPSDPVVTNSSPAIIVAAAAPTANNERAPPVLTATVPSPTGITPEPIPKPQPSATLPPASDTAQASPLITPSSPPEKSSRSRNFTNSIGMAMVWVPKLPGGSDGGWAGMFEVTQGEFEKITGNNPSTSKNPAHPVESVTWDQAADFCRKLTEKEGSEKQLPSGFEYHLPTQAQWDELIADAKFEDNVTSRDMSGGAFRSSPSVVGSMSPNKLGLFDLLGNVWEWCADSQPGAQHSARGGSYESTLRLGIKAFDLSQPYKPSLAAKRDVGFRCVLTQ